MCEKCEETIYNTDGSLKADGSAGTLADALVDMGAETTSLVIDDGINLIGSLALMRLAGYMTAEENNACRVLTKSLRDAAKRLDI